MKYISFVCFSTLIVLVQGFITNIEKKAPLVISSESEKLKNVFSHKKSTTLLVDYDMESFNMENIKLMYNHVHEFSLLLEYIRQVKTCRIVNFKLNKNINDSDQFHLETQVFNILRAFLSGMYSVDPMFFPKTWKEFEKLDKLNDNKEKKELFYFSDKKMYQGKLKRFDSFYQKKYETSRNLLTFCDYEIAQHMTYLKDLENPIAVKVTGRISNKKILKFMSELNPQNETGKLMMILSCNKLQSKRRQIPLLLNSLNFDQRRNTLFSLHINKFVPLEKQVEFFYKLTEENDIQNSGFYLNFKIRNETIC